MNRDEIFEEWKENLNDKDKSELFEYFKDGVVITEMNGFEEYFKEMIDEAYPEVEAFGRTFQASKIFDAVHSETDARIARAEYADSIEYENMPSFVQEKWDNWIDNELTEARLPSDFKSQFQSHVEELENDLDR